MKMTRRTLLRSTALTTAAFALRGNVALADPLSLPAGLQLYSVRDQMAQDLDGTLAAEEIRKGDPGLVGQSRSALCQRPLRLCRRHDAF